MIPAKLDDAIRRAAALRWVQALADASGQPLLFVFTPPKRIVDTPAHLWYVTSADTAEPAEVRTGEVVRPGDRDSDGLPVPAVCPEPLQPPPPPPTPTELLAAECPLRLLAWEHGLGWCRHFHLPGGGARVHCYGRDCVPPEGALPTPLQAALANHERSDS